MGFVRQSKYIFRWILQFIFGKKQKYFWICQKYIETSVSNPPNMKILFLNGGNDFLLRIPLQIQLHICTFYSNRVYAPIFMVRSTTILHQCDVSFSACPVPWMQFSRAENSEFLFGILFNRKCCFREPKLHIHTYYLVNIYFSQNKLPA